MTRDTETLILIGARVNEILLGEAHSYKTYSHTPLVCLFVRLFVCMYVTPVYEQ